MEIYNEDIRDLIAAPGRESDIRARRPGKLQASVTEKGVSIPGLSVVEVKVPQEVRVISVFYSSIAKPTVIGSMIQTP